MTNSTIAAVPLNENTDPDIISLRVQDGQSKSRVTISIHRMAPLSNLMTQYCSMRNITLGSVAFQFDGDAISPKDTAASLDLDNDFCIDVIEM